MTTEQSEALEKIQKTLNLARNASTKGEAEAAFAAATRMMTKHGITESQVEHAGKKENRIHFEAVKMEGEWAKERPEHRFIIDILRRCFHVSVIQGRVYDPIGFRIEKIEYSMLGDPMDCQFAMYAFEFLSHTFHDLFFDYLAKPFVVDNSTTRNSFYHGLWVGFREAFEKAQKDEMNANDAAQSYALVLVDKEQALKQALARKGYVESTSQAASARVDRNAYLSGHKEGQKIKVNPAIA